MFENVEWSRWAFDAPLGIGVAIAIGGFAFVLGIIAGPRSVAVPDFDSATVSSRTDIAWLLGLMLRVTVLMLVALTLARPVGLISESSANGSGIDLVIALDASGSMRALDADIDGRRVTRLELAKRVVADFIRARPNDRVGLIVFGEHAYTQCPLTVDQDFLIQAVQRVQTGIAGDSTALGEAVGIAVKRLVPNAKELGNAEEFDGERVLVVVTDGRHNAGKLTPETAARIAALHHVRIHTIGIGSQGPVPFATDTPGTPLRFEKVDLDQDALETLAELTGGSFFHARKPTDLKGVAEQIDRLEPSPRADGTRFRRASLVPSFIALALVGYLLETLFTHGIARRLP